MRKLAFAALAVIIGSAGASAQNNTATQPTQPGVQAPQGTTSPATVAAPVGKRQPRRADVPQDSPGQFEQSPEDRELDRRIKSICKGC